ncbi:MAG: YgiT-type zinc finger protein [Desulfuromonadales bacterium]
MICDICGTDGADIKQVSRSCDKKKELLIIEDIPVVSCGESYMNNDETLLVGTDPESLTRDCRQLRDYSITDLPTADEVIAFLDGYNSFINHETRPFTPMREVNMLL